MPGSTNKKTQLFKLSIFVVSLGVGSTNLTLHGALLVKFVRVAFEKLFENCMETKKQRHWIFPSGNE